MDQHEDKQAGKDLPEDFQLETGERRVALVGADQECGEQGP